MTSHYNAKTSFVEDNDFPKFNFSTLVTHGNADGKKHPYGNVVIGATRRQKTGPKGKSSVVNRKRSEQLGLPDPINCNFVWTVGTSFTLSGLESQVFRANSPYDPNQTGIGNQPAQFDEMMTLFSRACCISSRIRVDVANEADYALFVGVMAIAHSTATPTWDQAMMSNNFTYSLFSGRSGGKSIGTVQQYCNMRNLLHVNPLTAPDYDTKASSNPDVQAYYHLMIRNANTSNANNAHLRVTIEYRCVLKDRIPVAFS